MPRRSAREIILALHDFSRGLLSGISERAIARPNFLAGADNLYGRPYRALRMRPGSRDISTAALTVAPHSLMAYYSSGGNKAFVAAGPNIYEAQAAAYPAQTLPGGHLTSSDILSHANLDAALIVTQRGGALVPLMYDGAWKELKLPKPTDAIGFAADSAGGSVDLGDHYYRIRWRFARGSSLVGPVSAVRTVAGANKTVNINAGLTASGRSDYVGWTLERTKVNGTAAGPWWFVADGNTTTYADSKSDASLGYMADEGLHGEPPHFDGLTAFAGLLWGWAGSKLYASRDIGDLEATGVANFDADDLFQISKDDGDTIQVCLVVLDELLILKKRSVHVISGTDRESFTLTSVVYADPARGSEAGCAGPRAACVIGGKAYFWGEAGGLFVYSRGSVSPFGWEEVGRYLEAVNPAALDQILLINHQGNYLLAWYPSGSKTVAGEMLVYDARFKQWWHWKGWVARDAIELKGGLFSSATLLFCDPVLVEPSSSGAAAGDPSYSIYGRSDEYYVQKFNSLGVAQWTADGVQVSVSAVDPFNHDAACIPDGAGGVICAYIEGTATTDGRIVLQRLDSAGAKLWGVGGVIVDSVAAERRVSLDLVSDGAGGAIVVWITGTSNQWLYAQRLNAAGVIQWTVGGVNFYGTGISDERAVKAIADKSGGVYAAWWSAGLLRTVRLNSSGTIVVGWGTTKTGPAMDVGRVGLALDAEGGLWVGADTTSACNVMRFALADGSLPFAAVDITAAITPNALAHPSIVADGAGGIMAFVHTFPWTASTYKVQGWRVSSTGTLVWAAAGTDLTGETEAQPNAPRAVEDGALGAIVVWSSGAATARAFYAHRVSPAPQLLWGSNPVVWRDIGTVGGAANDITIYRISSDGGGGVIVFWSDDRGGLPDRGFIQRLNSDGVEQWTADGVQVTTTTGVTVRDQEFTGAAEGTVPAAGVAGYHVWAAFDGVKDHRKSDGTEGSLIEVVAETPWLDAGLPEDWKDLDRISVSAAGDQPALTVSIATDPVGGDAAFLLPEVLAPGKDWAEDVDTNPNVLVWDEGDWAGDVSLGGSSTSGIRAGTIGKRFKLRLSATPESDYQPTGIELVAVLLPDKEYDR